ncbi:MAG: GIY-YIG nuclease family protein [Bacteroidota bacterium]
MPRRLRRLSLSLKRETAIAATRVTIGKDRLVYVLVADKRLKYNFGKSRIAYIGTTKKGLSRISQSVASRADQILSTPGVRSFSARIVTCKRRRKVKTWHKLERALLLEFKERFQSVPTCNRKGIRMKETDEFRYFSKSAVRNVIDELV